jgi:hypothetical protein
VFLHDAPAGREVGSVQEAHGNRGIQARSLLCRQACVFKPPARRRRGIADPILSEKDLRMQHVGGAEKSTKAACFKGRHRLGEELVRPLEVPALDLRLSCEQCGFADERVVSTTHGNRQSFIGVLTSGDR